MSARDWQMLGLDAGRVFSPTAPIDERSLFAGRDRQVQQVIDAVNQKGQHAILFGERGVGKTSLANVLSSFLVGHPSGTIIAPRINCDSTDTFDSAWDKIFKRITFSNEVRKAGFEREKEVLTSALADHVDRPFTPDTVQRVLASLATSALPIVIIDEFDRLTQVPRLAFADTIKTLSDNAVGATLVIVGVADSVDQLIQQHQSIERALVQVRMPRMSTTEIETIITNGLGSLRMAITADALRRIATLSQGLPHYAHLIGLNAARVAVASQRLTVDLGMVNEAIKRALEGAQQSIRSSYHAAIRSARKQNLFADVLLACALAETDQLGFFAAQDVRGPLRKITGKPYDIPTFAQHLNEFVDEKRGSILHKTGTQRLYRYRFDNPLMQPFIIMTGYADGKMAAIDGQPLKD
jgi:Cdc6-like AAA superfamily ATPase